MVIPRKLLFFSPIDYLLNVNWPFFGGVMEYRLKDLLDLPRLQSLLNTLDQIHSMPSAIIDIEGNILTATAWQDICTKFHRAHPETEKNVLKVIPISTQGLTGKHPI
jgi:hypothetical protein